MTKSKSATCNTQVTRSGRYTPENQYVSGKMVLGRLLSFWNGLQLWLTVTWSRHLGVLNQEIHLSSVPAFLARTLQYQYHNISHIPIQFSLPGSCSGRFWLHPPLLVTNVASTCTETMLSSGSLPTCAGLGSGSRASCLCLFHSWNMFTLIHQWGNNKISLEIALLVCDSFFFTVSGLCYPDFWVVPAEREIKSWMRLSQHQGGRVM